MKNNLIVAALMTAALSAYASADDGQVNFVGSITDDACTVVNNMSSPLTVTLGNISSKAFTATGSTAAPTKFTIALKNCPEATTSAKVKFDGVADSNVNTLLALTQGAGVATNVAIQLTDDKNVAVPLYTESASYPLTVGDNNLDFIARYYATADVVTPGSANASSNFTIIYN